MATTKKTNNNKKTKKKVVNLTKVSPNEKIKTKSNSNTKKKLATITKEEKNPSKTKKRKRRFLNFLLSCLMIFGITIMSLVVAFCAYIVISAPDFDTDLLYSNEASVFYDREGNEIGRVGAEQRELVTYEDLPEVLVDAIVAVEDSRFFQHNGFDIARFMKASAGQLKGNSNAGGASTLTMQIVKNTFTSTEASGIKGIIRKFTDIYMSVFLVERNYTKEEIIEFYVNAPFLGWNTYGVEQASQVYFGKSVRDLSLPEASLLAGIFNAPSSYNPFYSSEMASSRRDTVLNLMVKHGYITEKQCEEAKAIPVESLIVEQKNVSNNPYQVFIDTAANEVETKTGLNPYNVSMEVYTTMDPEMQQVMVDLNNEKIGYKWQKDWLQVAGIITDVKDGSIRAVNGGRTVGARLYNRATDTKTQPGSTAKPFFAYGPFIEYNNGSPSTLFWDNKMTYSNGQSVKNSDGSYYGQMTMRQALARSRNIPAIQAFQAVDNNKISEFVLGCGLDYRRKDADGNITDDNLFESYAIGGGLTFSPKDMAGAYATIARGGYYIEPYSVTKVIYLETDEVYEPKVEKTKAMSEETAYMLTDILMTAKSQGVGGNFSISGTDIAAKTGTSTYSSQTIKTYNLPDSASADNWVITYSPDYVITFWYGVDQPKKGEYTTALGGATEVRKISNTVAPKIYKKNSKFSKPSGVVQSKYELETFPPQLPSSYTPSNLISADIFKKGTEPSEISERFDQLKNPSNGSATVLNGVVTLNWTGINTPDAISETYQTKFFKENFKQFANSYLPKRLNYIQNNIGNLGYQIYLSTDEGLTPLGFTENTYFNYSATFQGLNTYVVKSAYSIFKSNMSSGLTITVNVGDVPNITPTPSPDDPQNPEDPEEHQENEPEVPGLE